MKKYATVVIILILVILAHIFFIKPLISEKTEKKAEAPASSVTQPVKNDASTPAKKEPVRKLFKHPSKNPLFGKFYDYRKAVWDDKLPVPGSKQAQSGILVDLDTHMVLWAKEPRQGRPIASMTKMMTLLLAFEAMDKRDDLDLDTPVKVTSKAAGMGGSQVYLDVRETHPFGELLKAMAIKSANDCACLVGEYISGGNLPEFIAAMNRRAYKLRMASTDFVNPHGLPDRNKKDSTSSPEGMAVLAEHLLQYPLLIKWTSTIHEYFRPKGSKGCQFLTNTNHKLLKQCSGVNGLKTGYTKAAGFCVTATCLRGSRHLVAVVTGFKSQRNRTAFVKRLLDWGYRRSASLKTPSNSANK
jgi:D-alanyl-D-alanine carboxypeptidase (penicillin-binding protein 5/6)